MALCRYASRIDTASFSFIVSFLLWSVMAHLSFYAKIYANITKAILELNFATTITVVINLKVRAQSFARLRALLAQEMMKILQNDRKMEDATMP